MKSRRCVFLSTLSLRRATGKPKALKSRLCVFLSTLSLRRATDETQQNGRKNHISIHTLLAESDSFIQTKDTLKANFYPHSPCGERRVVSVQIGRNVYFYPHSPCGERQHRTGDFNGVHYFYPHSPCGERQTQEPKPTRQNQFLSTLSLRRATNDAINGCNPDYISIHTLLAESDLLIN